MGELYSKITDFDTLYQAFLTARKGKRYRPEVVRFTHNLEENLIDIHNRLVWETWEPSPPREFVIMEPKMRYIQAPPFADRVVQHALVDTVEPLFDRRFINHSYACRTGRGTHAAVANLQKMMRKAQGQWGEVWAVQADVKSFFASISHAVALDAIAKVIDCPRTISLFATILAGYGHDSGYGLPVGALTSQLGANITLDIIDHRMTDMHGAGRYLRYMDDIIILAPTKEQAHELLELLRLEIEAIHLRLNPKSRVLPARCGIDWCGYRTWATHVLPRKKTIKRGRKRITKAARRVAGGKSTAIEITQAVNSLKAYAKHCNSETIMAAISNDIEQITGVQYAH